MLGSIKTKCGGEGTMRLAFGLVAALPLFLAAGQASAQANYPDKPVRFIVGFTPGSATDITARLFAAKFAEAWKVPVTVENIPGAGGSVGGDRVAKSAPDGTTFYWGANGALTINPTLQANPTYDVVRDLTPVVRLLTMASIIAVNNDVPAKSFPELIALAKAQPGQLSYASPGVGTPQHIAGELLKSLAGVNITHVPYRGAVFTDVIGGRVSMTLQNMGTILPIVKDGRLRGLAVTSLKRTPVVDLPTVAESGLPGFEATSWFGLMAPAGTPAPIVAKAAQQAIAVTAMADVREKLSALGLDTTADTGNAFATIIKADTAKWAKVIKDANIKVGD
jgi:tripartite-type tricarboxylate transporter receptor subunit TctC